MWLQLTPDNALSKRESTTTLLDAAAGTPSLSFPGEDNMRRVQQEFANTRQPLPVKLNSGSVLLARQVATGRTASFLFASVNQMYMVHTNANPCRHPILSSLLSLADTVLVLQLQVFPLAEPGGACLSASLIRTRAIQYAHCCWEN